MASDVTDAHPSSAGSEKGQRLTRTRSVAGPRVPITRSRLPDFWLMPSGSVRSKGRHELLQGEDGVARHDIEDRPANLVRQDRQPFLCRVSSRAWRDMSCHRWHAGETE